MRQRAAESDVVIVNHHLLCADAAVRQSNFGEVIPSCSFAVVDEAHQLEDVATQYFGLSVSSYRIDDLARDVGRALGARLVTRPRSRRADRCRRGPADPRSLATFFAAVEMLRHELPGGAANDSRLRVRSKDMQRLGEDGATLIAALEALEADIALTRTCRRTCWRSARRASEMRDEIRFLLRADDPGYVYFLETRGRGVFLRASPIDVSTIVRDVLLRPDARDGADLGDADGGRRFDYVRGRLGLRRAQEIRLDSEFDYQRQAILYLPKKNAGPAGARIRGRRCPRDPRHPQADPRARVRAVHELREPARGATGSPPPSSSIRFSSRVARRDRRCSANSKRRRTPSCSPPRASGRAWTSSATRSAASSSTSCRSPRPAIRSPRRASKRSRARGRVGIRQYQIPLAILALKQGLGRLLGTGSDRGVLAVLDPRLKTMGYGRAIPRVVAAGARHLAVCRHRALLRRDQPMRRRRATTGGGCGGPADPEVGGRQAPAPARRCGLTIRPHFTRYVEPFLGSGAVFLDCHNQGLLDGRDVRLSDINADVIGCYRMVRDAVEAVIDALDGLEAGYQRGGARHFYAVRDSQFNRSRGGTSTPRRIPRGPIRRPWRRC